MPENDSLLTISSTAGRLGVSKATLRKWDAEGKLKPIRIGTRGDRRYQLEDVQRFLGGQKAAFKPIDLNDLHAWLDKNELWFEEGPILPMPIQKGMEEFPESKWWEGKGFTYCVFMHEKDYAHQILSVPESIEVCKEQLRILHTNPTHIDHFLKEWNVRVERLQDTINRLDFIDLEKCSQEKLLAEFEKLNESTRDFWNITLTIEPYSPFLDSVYYPQFEKKIGNPQKARESFAVLTTPVQFSFIGEERRDLIHLMVDHLHKPAERKAMLEMEASDFLAQKRKEDPRFYEELVKHQQNYYWIQNSYGEWTILSISDFLQFMKDALKSHSIHDLKEEWQRMKNTQPLVEKQKRLISELQLDPQTVAEIQFIQHITWLRDERKKMALQMLHCQFRFIHEFSRRTSLEPKLVAHAFTEEIPAILNRSFPLSLLEERRTLSFFLTRNGRHRSFVVGNEAEILKHRIFGSKTKQSNEAIHGIVASRGPESVVTGKVKVILTPKDQTISTDEILVTSMTRPDFVPLMKNAKAIITNEGGITCHAAIVSREMNKPCVIGTQFATKALQTGDEVEMRMNHGIINIKKRSEM